MGNLSKQELFDAMSEPTEKGCFNCEKWNGKICKVTMAGSGKTGHQKNLISFICHTYNINKTNANADSPIEDQVRVMPLIRWKWNGVKG